MNEEDVKEGKVSSIPSISLNSPLLSSLTIISLLLILTSSKISNIMTVFYNFEISLLQPHQKIYYYLRIYQLNHYLIRNVNIIIRITGIMNTKRKIVIMNIICLCLCLCLFAKLTSCQSLGLCGRSN